MKDNEFYSEYANTPIQHRFKVIDFGKYGLMTLNGLYERVHAIDDKIRPDVIEKDDLIETAEWFFRELKKFIK